MFYGTMLTVNFDEGTEYACYAGLVYPHLTPDDYVVSCDMAMMQMIKSRCADLIFRITSTARILQLKQEV